MSKLLITGSSGYIGSRLIKTLANSDHELVCTARNPDYIREKLPKNASAVMADFSTEIPLDTVFNECDTAFFLMHSLGEKENFEEMEEKLAKHFIDAAAKSSVKKIIYLGGLMDENKDTLSPHMRSRKKVGDILRSTHIPVVEFRASIILGPGSTSFELIRALVERLPIMVTPKWVRVKAQPIYIDDVIAYLISTLDKDPKQSEIVEIGGQDVVTYRQIMKAYADERQLKRFMIPVPFLTPHLSSLWLGLVTPIYARVGRKLIDSITGKSIVTHPENAKKYPVNPISTKGAIKNCLRYEDLEIGEARWSDAISNSMPFQTDKNPTYGNRIIDVYEIDIPDHIKHPFKPVESIGGQNGWYHMNFLWKLRGFIDLLFGGIGIRRGRTHPTSISTGDTIDWWRVTAYTPDEHLRLKAEMKLPGRAWLDFEIISTEDKRLLRQTVIFDPLGLWGLLYWYSLLPIHKQIFRGMLKKIIKKGASRP